MVLWRSVWSLCRNRFSDVGEKNQRENQAAALNGAHVEMRDDEFTARDRLKGLGHAILGNFSTDRMVIELTKILK